MHRKTITYTFLAFWLAASSYLLPGVAGNDCTQYTNTRSEVGATIQWVSTNTTISMFINTTKVGWVAIGRSKTGGMIGSDAVIGIPVSNGLGTVERYNLNGAAVSQVVRSTNQTLTDTEVTQTEDGTAMKFTQNLSDGPVPLNSTGLATFIWAVGSDNTLAYHAIRGKFSVPLIPCVPTSSIEPTQKPNEAPYSQQPIIGPTAQPTKKKSEAPYSQQPNIAPTAQPTKKKSSLSPTSRPVQSVPSSSFTMSTTMWAKCVFIFMASLIVVF